MNIFPAIDLVDKKAVRLYKGDYAQMTVYSEHPEEIARDIVACGAGHIHIVDLEGAKDGTTPNLSTVCAITPSAYRVCSLPGSSVSTSFGWSVRIVDVRNAYSLLSPPSALSTPLSFCASVSLP